MSAFEQPQEASHVARWVAHPTEVRAALPLPLQRRIARLQAKVAEVADRNGLSHPETVAASQELDALIAVAMRIVNRPEPDGR